MKIVQAAVLVLVGALGAILYVKVKGGPDSTTPTAIEVEAHSQGQPTEAKPIEAKPVEAQPIEAEEPVAPPIPDPPASVLRRDRKQAHAPVLTSSLRRNEPRKIEPLSRPADVRPADIRPD